MLFIIIAFCIQKINVLHYQLNCVYTLLVEIYRVKYTPTHTLTHKHTSVT